MPIQIHGKEYKTVAERLDEIGKDLLSVSTEVLYQSPVVIKATITTNKGVFTGISAANPNKTIEKQSPYEVAETSAVGRALSFAGYAGSEIASAEEMYKALSTESEVKPLGSYPSEDDGITREPVKDLLDEIEDWCSVHDVKMYPKEGKFGKFYSHSEGEYPDVKYCNGKGYK